MFIRTIFLNQQFVGQSKFLYGTQNGSMYVHHDDFPHVKFEFDLSLLLHKPLLNKILCTTLK